MITIYGLTDKHGIIRYVGQTINPSSRFMSHCKARKHFTPTGLAPLQIVKTNAAACRAERKWIKFFGLDNLLNGMAAPRSIRRMTTESTSSISIRVSREDMRRLEMIAGPHGSVSRVLRSLIERHTQTAIHVDTKVLLPNKRTLIQMAKRRKG